MRVHDEAAAELIRPVLPPGIKLEVGASPELVALARMLGERLAGEANPSPASYLENGRVPSAAVACLFRVAEALYRRAPWRSLDDSAVFELDVPAMGISGACVSVVGALEQNFGFLVFDSFDDYDEFGSREPGIAAGEMDTGVTFLALNYERGADIPEAMRREITRHRWPVAGPRGFPLLFALERDGDMRQLEERDVRLASAIAGALTAFATRHARWLSAPPPEVVSESVTVETPEPIQEIIRFPHPGRRSGIPHLSTASGQAQAV